MPEKVRVHHGVALLYGGVRLHQLVGHHRRQDLLRARRTQSVDKHTRSDQTDRPQDGSASRRTDVRPSLVRAIARARFSRRSRRSAPPRSDPEETLGWGVSPRGAGYLFGSDVVSQFNQTNNIDLICRAHQLVMEGYKWHFNETVLTVWSAPNYCYRCGNVAAILELDEHLNRSFTIFEAAPQDQRSAATKRVVPDYFL